MKNKEYILISACILCFCGLLFFAMADDDLARAFTAKGDEAVKKGQIQQGIEFYQKALKESPEIPEIHFKIGEAYLKLANKGKSRVAFKKCITLIDKISKPSPALLKTKKQAETNLSNLEATRKEGKSIEQEYIKELLAFVKKTKAKDSRLTEDVLNQVLEIDPKNIDARKEIDDLKKKTPIPRWESLIKGVMDEWLTPFSGEWAIGNNENEMVADTKRWIRIIYSKLKFENNFKLSMEFKVENSYQEDEGGGFLIGYEKALRYLTVAIRGKSIVEIFQYTSKSADEDGRYIPLKSAPVTNVYKRDDWNKLQAEVTGTVIKVYVNGQMVMEFDTQDKSVLRGEVGLCSQGNRVTFSNFRYLK